LTSTEDKLLGQVSYQAQREDKPAAEVVPPVPHPPLTWDLPPQKGHGTDPAGPR
jgi:hypothetical protein